MRGHVLRRSEANGGTYVLPDGLDITAYATHLDAVTKADLKAKISAKRYDDRRTDAGAGITP